MLLESAREYQESDANRAEEGHDHKSVRRIKLSGVCRDCILNSRCCCGCCGARGFMIEMETKKVWEIS